MGVSRAEFVATYPRLYHMTEAGAWPSIEAHGLRSAASLVAAHGAPASLVRGRRAQAARLADGVVLRDNGVLDDERLAACLVGTDLAGFYRLLNSRVYFWPARHRVEGLLRARAYRDREHLVLTLDTAALLDAHDVRLCPINLGSTLFTPPPRGPGSLYPLADYPWAERVRARGRRDAVAEVSVADAVPDVAPLLVDKALRACEHFSGS